MNKKHTMPSRLIELEHELASTLRKVDEQSELLRLSQEENEEKRKDVVWLATEKAKLENYVTELENRLRALWDKYDGERKHYMERIKRLEEAGDAMASILNNTRKDWYTSDQCEVSAFNWNEAKENK